MPFPLSIAIISCNEEANIARCLRSAKRLASEIRIWGGVTGFGAKARNQKWLESPEHDFIKRVSSVILDGGFMDGFPGLWIATATAFSAFVRCSRKYEDEVSSSE